MRGILDLHGLDPFGGSLHRGDPGGVESGCQLDLRRRRLGRVIPHAGARKSPAKTSRTFPIAVIEASFGTAAMPPPGPTQAVAAGTQGARRPAVDVTSVAVRADGEQALTAGTPRQSQRLDRFHPPPPPLDGRRGGGPGNVAKTCDNRGRASVAVNDLARP